MNESGGQRRRASRRCWAGDRHPCRLQARGSGAAPLRAGRRAAGTLQRARRSPDRQHGLVQAVDPHALPPKSLGATGEAQRGAAKNPTERGTASMRYFKRLLLKVAMPHSCSWIPLVTMLAVACVVPANDPPVPEPESGAVTCFSDVQVTGATLDPGYTHGATEASAAIALGAETATVTLTDVAAGDADLDGSGAAALDVEGRGRVAWTGSAAWARPARPRPARVGADAAGSRFDEDKRRPPNVLTSATPPLGPRRHDT